MPAVNRYAKFADSTAQGLLYPASHAEAVTPSDDNDLSAVSRELYVGTVGDITLVMLSGATVTFPAVPAGTMLKVRASRVRASGTSASQIVSLS